MCEPKRGVSLAGPVAVLGAVAVAPLAYTVIGTVIAAVVAAEAVLAVAGIVVLRHLVLYGRARKPRPARAVARAAVPARAPRAVEGPRQAPGVILRGEVISDVVERQQLRRG